MLKSVLSALCEVAQKSVSQKHGAMTWKVMLQSVLIAFAKWRKSQFHKVSTLCLDDHQIKVEDLEAVGELSETCSPDVLTCFFLTRIGHLELLWRRGQFGRISHKMDQSLQTKKACKTCKLH